MKNILTILMSLLAVSAFAAPARPGVVKEMVQPDGSVVTLSLHGDEHCHYYLTSDGHTVLAQDGAYYYATVGAAGDAMLSAVLAHNPADRGTVEAQMLSGIDDSAVREALTLKGNTQRRSTHEGIGTSQPDYPTMGQRKGLVFLVQYADVEFTLDDPYDYFSRMLNEEGFSLQNGTGSARDYFISSSNGYYTPDFDVYGPVTLPEDRAYYGANQGGSDKNPHYMMLHAAQILKEDVDFSQYDLDGDGYIDFVFVIYAGEGESSGAGEDAVWPHSWQYRFGESFNGVRLNKYACAPEIAYGTTPDGIGTFCHEFCHVLGLPDLYNTNDPNASYTPQYWSVLDVGCYCNDGRTPPSLSAFERNALGWMGDLLYEPIDAGEYSLMSLEGGNGALLIPTEKESEFFIFENRQQQGWDKYLPYHGMLVWHIDYDRTAWYNNTPNNNKSHQRIDIVEACDRTYSNTTGLRKYPFPGKDGVTEFFFGGKPSFQDWAGNDLGYVLTNIREQDGVITFDLSGEAGISNVKADSDAWLLSGNRLTAIEALTVTDLCGRAITMSPGSSVALHSGLYIISTSKCHTKLILR